MNFLSLGDRFFRFSLVISVAFFCWSFSEGSQYRTWISNDGKEIEARIVENDPARQEVQLRLRNGAVFTVPWSRFSRQDREFLEDLLPVPGVFLDAKSSRVSSRENLYRSTYGTFRTDAYSDARRIEARIRNNGDLEYPFIVRAWVLARPRTGASRLVVFDFDEKIVEIEGGRSGVYEYFSESIEREESNWGYRAGDNVEMDGWVISVHSREGELIRHTGSNPSRERLFEENWEDWLKEIKEEPKRDLNRR